MELGEAIRRRRMCRSFTDEPIEPGVVDRLLALARRAPSAGHTQGWAWLVLEGSELTSRFWALDADPAWLAAPTWPGLLRAPVILVPLSSPAAYRDRYAEADKSDRRLPGGPGSVSAPTAHPDPSVSAPTDHPDPSAEADESARRRPGEPAPGLTSTPPGDEVPGADWPVPWWDVDISFAVMLLLLAATDAALGALFFALHGDPVRLMAGFGVPEGWRPLGAIALGHPAPDATPSPSAVRGWRPEAEVVHRGRW